MPAVGGDEWWLGCMQPRVQQGGAKRQLTTTPSLNLTNVLPAPAGGGISRAATGPGAAAAAVRVHTERQPAAAAAAGLLPAVLRLGVGIGQQARAAALGWQKGSCPDAPACLHAYKMAALHCPGLLASACPTLA